MKLIKIIGAILGYLIAAFLIFSGIMKIIGGAETEAHFNLGNVNGWYLIIAIGEITAAVLFVLPKTLVLGTLLLSAYFGGAIMFHMSHPVQEFSNFTVPAIILIAIWLTAWMRGLKLIA